MCICYKDGQMKFAEWAKMIGCIINEENIDDMKRSHRSKSDTCCSVKSDLWTLTLNSKLSLIVKIS